MYSLDRFNSQILESVKMIAGSRARLGYDINSYFTQNLRYGPHCCINANHPPRTMCVAAVMEIIIEALNIYFTATHDGVPFDKLPLRSWTHGTIKDIRAHIFMYAGTKSRGTAHALSRFGIGKEVAFEDMEPGDFVNFNRSHSGHAAVFLGFINKDYDIEAAYSKRVVGFHYFSAQGAHSADAGFGYRWAFFGSVCPAPPAGKVRDCGVRFSDDPSILNTGCMLHPRSWQLSMASDKLNNLFLDELMRDNKELSIDELSRELKPSDLSRFDGVTE